MFSPINFNPCVMNPFTMNIMQSAQNADNVIEAFEQAFSAGLSSEEALKEALRITKVNLNSLEFFDLNRVNRLVESVSNCNKTGRRY